MDYTYDDLDEVLNTQGEIIPLPWNTPECADRASEASSYSRLNRAAELSKSVPAFTCKYCGRILPGVTLSGTLRKACDNPKCYGVFWHDKSLAYTQHMQSTTDPDTPIRFGELTKNQVLAIRKLHSQGLSYKAIQSELKIRSKSVVAGVVRGERYTWVVDAETESRVVKENSEPTSSGNDLFDCDFGLPSYQGDIHV